MPRKRNETDQQWMARLRAARGLVEACNDDEALKFRAFMGIMHPEVSQAAVDDAAREIKARTRRR